MARAVAMAPRLSTLLSAALLAGTALVLAPAASADYECNTQVVTFQHAVCLAETAVDRHFNCSPAQTVQCVNQDRAAVVAYVDCYRSTAPNDWPDRCH